MSRTFLLWAMLAGLSAGHAADTFRDQAEVLRVEPLLRSTAVQEPRALCRTQPPPVQGTPGADMLALLRWNAAGGGEGCDDTIAGHAIQQRVEGYRVTYRYRGQVFTRILDHDPGNTLPVRVRLRAAGP